MPITEPPAQYLPAMIEAAIRAGASDIHFEPEQSHCRVRWRIDGQLSAAPQPQVEGRERLVSSLKVLARLDIAEKRLPQDGRFDFSLSDGVLHDIRLSVLPTTQGEKLVLRIMAPAQALPLTALGLAASQLTMLQHALARPHGMVLMAGPTGSGKSTSLYACLQSLPVAQLNVCTVEDPVEVALPGVTQVAVCHKSGLDFPCALRALLRQDPDVLMVGEIRDAATAEIAIKAAQTGHLVLSSVHAASARATVARLLNMGVAPLHLSAALSLIGSQRLLRRLCPHCRREVPWPPPWRGQAVAGGACYEAVGCDACRGSGYQGRVGVFELLPLAEASISAQGGLRLPAGRGGSLRQAGLVLVRTGVTSLAEVLANTTD